MRTFQSWVGDEHPELYDENWKNLLWAGPLAATIGLGMHYGNKKKTAEIPDPEPKIQHVKAADVEPTSAKYPKVVMHAPAVKSSRVVSSDDDATVKSRSDDVPAAKSSRVVSDDVPAAKSSRVVSDDVPAAKSSRVVSDDGRLKTTKPIIKDTKDQPEPEQVKLVHDKTPPTAEEIKISHGQPYVKEIKVGDKVIYRSIGCAAVNLRDLNSAIKGARATAINNLMQQMQNKGVVRFRPGADKDVKIYTKSSKNGVTCVFVVREFDPNGISVTPELDDEGLPRESTSHRSFQSYVSYRRMTHM